MENRIMTLDENPQLLDDAVPAAAEALGILPAFVEKDYWITKMLCNLSQNRFADRIAFKGGTSLSKAYQLIARFSEDIDLAVLAEGMSGNQIKTLMSSVTKDISNGPLHPNPKEIITQIDTFNEQQLPRLKAAI